MTTDPAFTRGPARRPAPTHSDGALRFEPHATIGEAETRFWRRYGLALVAALLGLPTPPKPQTVDDWVALAEAVRDVLKAQAAGRGKVGGG